MDDETKSASLGDKVERAIQAGYLFVARYIRTAAVLALKPWRAAEVLDERELGGHQYLRPMTYFGIGAFILSVLIGTMQGVELRNLVVSAVFATDEFALNLLGELREGIKISDIVFVAVPALLAVVAGARTIGAIAFRSATDSRRFTDLALFGIGTQMLSYLCAVGYATFDSLHVVEGVGWAWWFDSVLEEGLGPVVFWALLVVSVLAPWLVPGCGLWSSIRASSSGFFIRSLVAISASSVVLPSIYLFVLSVPAWAERATLSSVSLDPVVLEFDDRAQVRLVASKDSVQLFIGGTLSNTLEGPLVMGVGALTFDDVVVSSLGWDDEEATDFALPRSEEDPVVLQISPHSCWPVVVSPGESRSFGATLVFAAWDSFGHAKGDIDALLEDYLLEFTARIAPRYGDPVSTSWVADLELAPEPGAE